MSDPMTPERLAEIRERAARITEYGGATADEERLAGVDVPALLAEVERLRAQLATVLTNCKQLQGEAITLEGERDEARAKAGRYIDRIQTLARKHSRAVALRATLRHLLRIQERCKHEARTERDRARAVAADAERLLGEQIERAVAAEADRDSARAALAAAERAAERAEQRWDDHRRRAARYRTAWRSARRGRAKARAEVEQLRAELEKARKGRTEQMLGRLDDWSGDLAAVVAERDAARAEVEQLRTRLQQALDDKNTAAAQATNQYAALHADRDRLAGQVQRVRDRHPRQTDSTDCTDGTTALGCQHDLGYHTVEYCGLCHEPWPCAEIRNLDGEEPRQ